MLMSARKDRILNARHPMAYVKQQHSWTLTSGQAQLVLNSKWYRACLNKPGKAWEQENTTARTRLSEA